MFKRKKPFMEASVTLTESVLIYVLICVTAAYCTLQKNLIEDDVSSKSSFSSKQDN